MVMENALVEWVLGMNRMGCMQGFVWCKVRNRRIDGVSSQVW